MAEQVHPTQGVYPINYWDRKLANKGLTWGNRPVTDFDPEGEPFLQRSDQGLEAVPGFFQMRSIHKNDPNKVPVFVHQFQRRRGTGLQKYHNPQIPLSNNFIRNFSIPQLTQMRRARGMYKLLFWNPSKYTPLQAHQWNQYLDEHPRSQLNFPVPRTPQDVLPPAPHPYNTYGLYDIPDYNHKAHEYDWDA